MSNQLRAWVESAPDDAETRRRQALHTVIAAMAASERLHLVSYIKGGQLLAIQYQSARFTADLDVSNPSLFEAEHETLVPSALKAALPGVVAQLGYGIDCRVQRCSKQPPREDATFVTLEMSVGYAAYGSREHKRLMNGQAPHVVEIDYSFNEVVADMDIVHTEMGDAHAYGVITVMAEKYRALLQQPLRERSRRQDAYDLDYIITRKGSFTDAERLMLVEFIVKKARSRGVEASPEAMFSQAVYEWSRHDYASLKDELPDGELPDFDAMFGRVRAFYSELPWDSVEWP